MDELDFESWIRARQREVADTINKTEAHIKAIEKQLAGLRAQTATLRGALVGLKEAETRFIAEMTNKGSDDETVHPNGEG